MIRAGIVGAAGYTGGELLRLLIHHPEVEVSFAHSRSQVGLPIHNVHTDLLGDSELSFTDQIHFDIDLLFLCMGHGASSEFMKENQVPDTVKIIDLSHDFRMPVSWRTLVVLRLPSNWHCCLWPITEC